MGSVCGLCRMHSMGGMYRSLMGTANLSSPLRLSPKPSIILSRQAPHLHLGGLAGQVVLGNAQRVVKHVPPLLQPQPPSYCVLST